MLAIIITIMVLELSVPEGITLSALRPLLPEFVSYVLSFIYLGIYWNNHHHMLHVTERVKGAVLWANLHLLFWLSLVPFTTGWMGESDFAPVPTALYGGVLLMAALAFLALERAIVAANGQNSLLASAVGGSNKEKLSLVLYIAGIIFAFVLPWIAGALYAVVALMWLIPDRRIERALAEGHGRDDGRQRAESSLDKHQG